jgi:hypothetical protein
LSVRLLIPALLLAAFATAVAASARADEPPEQRYDVLYDVQIVPTERSARVAVRLTRGAEHVSWIRFRIDPERHWNFSGPGRLQIEAHRVKWYPPAEGGTLSYSFKIDHLRDERSYDSRCTDSWAILRGDDLVPPARVRARRGAHSHSRLRLRLPEGWSAATPYPRSRGSDYRISHPHRRFDRPTGWFVLGDLGILRERISGVSVTIAGPRGHSLRRMDLLALLNWTLPTLDEILGSLPKRVLITGAGDPMWRGGLSGPGSIYVHAQLPLITEDATSTPLHEIVHVTLGIRPAADADWIVEGLAEFYALEVLRRSGSLSSSRYERAVERLAERGRASGRLRGGRATGAQMARAVTVLRALDEKIRAATDGLRSLDDVARALAEEGGEVSTASFQALVERVAGSRFEAFFSANAPAR